MNYEEEAKKLLGELVDDTYQQKWKIKQIVSLCQRVEREAQIIQILSRARTLKDIPLIEPSRCRSQNGLAEES